MTVAQEVDAMNQILGRLPLRLAALALVAGMLVGCAAAAPTAAGPAPEDPSPTAAPTTESAGPVPTSGPSGSRDFSDINVCELVTPEEVGALAGGVADPDPNQQSEADYTMCWYEIDDGTGAYAYYIVYVETAELGETALALEEIGDPVDGLGEEAYLRFDESEDQFRLIVLRRGDYAIDLAGTDSDVMVEIARLLIERFGE
jgi:hypothetical protein